MVKCTLEFRIPESTVTRDGNRFTENFEAEEDLSAIVRGKHIFLDKVKSAYISKESVLTAIYRTPENLLKKKCKVSAKERR